MTLPSKALDINSAAFCGCSSLVEFVIDSPLFKSINGALYSSDAKRFIICPNGLQNITLERDTEVIGKHSFYECTKLKQVIMQDLVEILEPCAFFMCNEIEMVRLPASVTTIGKAAFDICAHLNYILYCNDKDSVECGEDLFPADPNIYVFYDFTDQSFCGYSCYAILDHQCNIPTNSFTGFGELKHQGICMRIVTYPFVIVFDV